MNTWHCEEQWEKVAVTLSNVPFPIHPQDPYQKTPAWCTKNWCLLNPRDSDWISLSFTQHLAPLNPIYQPTWQHGMAPLAKTQAQVVPCACTACSFYFLPPPCSFCFNSGSACPLSVNICSIVITVL